MAVGTLTDLVAEQPTAPAARGCTEEDRIFGYDVELLKAVVSVLRRHDYEKFQYIPTRANWLAVAKEHENLLNLFTRDKHLLFYYSLLPRLYRDLISGFKRERGVLFQACFCNKAYPARVLEKSFSRSLVQRLVDNQILIERGQELLFSLSFVPFGQHILIRDPYDTYPPVNREFDNQVWMGSDSVIFAKFLKQIGKEREFRRALEIGSGSGLQSTITAGFSGQCLAVDNNERAVQCTSINAALSGLSNLDVCHSDLFSNVNGKFDLILANPWFIDLEKGGLEELPGIAEGLNAHLTDDGWCVMIMDSYMQNGVDTTYNYLRDFVSEHGFDAELFTIGYGLDRANYDDFERYGIAYNILYYIVLKNGGSGRLTRYSCSRLRKLRDFTYIRGIRAFHSLRAASNRLRGSVTDRVDRPDGLRSSSHVES